MDWISHTLLYLGVFVRKKVAVGIRGGVADFRQDTLLLDSLP
jgi:hypothetical protein